MHEIVKLCKPRRKWIFGQQNIQQPFNFSKRVKACKKKLKDFGLRSSDQIFKTTEPNQKWDGAHGPRPTMQCLAHGAGIYTNTIQLNSFSIDVDMIS